MIRTLIVDDEQAARVKIAGYLAAHERFAVVGEAADGPSALDLLASRTVDLLFLDIQMPGMTGFDVLRLVPEGHMPAVVFTTAYDTYAVKAFEVAAVDYLLKPFGEARFNEALARVEAQREAPWQARVDAILDRLETETFPRRLAVRYLKRVRLLEVTAIERICAERGVTALYDFAGDRHWTEETLDRLERRLDPRSFFRIHRGSIINLAGKFEIEPWEDGRLRLHYPGGALLSVARDPAKRLRAMLGF